MVIRPAGGDVSTPLVERRGGPRSSTRSSSRESNHVELPTSLKTVDVFDPFIFSPRSDSNGWMSLSSTSSGCCRICYLALTLSHAACSPLVNVVLGKPIEHSAQDVFLMRGLFNRVAFVGVDD